MAKLKQEKLVWWLLGLAMAYYAIVFSLISIFSQMNFSTSAYDVGLYDQGVWLMSRFMAPFTTIKGVMLFGDHTSFYSLFLAPFYWLWPTINILYIAQSVLLALAALPLFLYAKKRLGLSFVALGVAVAFLFSPALQNMNLENFHPETMTLFFLMLSLYFLLTKQYRRYYPLLFLTLLGKEDVGLTVFFIGVSLILFRRELKHGVVTLFIGIGWYLLASRLIMPLMNGYSVFASGPVFYSYWFKDVATNIFNVKFLLARIFGQQALVYYLQLFGPVLFLNLLSPAMLFMLIPALAINVLSGSAYLSSVNFHYNYLTLAFVYFGLVEGLVWLGTKRFKLGWVVWLLLFVSLISNGLFSHLPFFRHISQTLHAFRQIDNPVNQARREAIKLIPVAASVSASHSLVPHLTHRQEIYMFPNPYRACMWNMWFKEGKDLPPVGQKIDYIVLDTSRHTDPTDRLIAEYLIGSSRYKKVFDQQNIIVLQNNHGKRVPNQGIGYKVLGSKGDIKYEGKFSMLYFPDSQYYFQSLLGEEVDASQPIDLKLSGYFFVPESGAYGVKAKSDGKLSLLIDNQVASSSMFLGEGFHKLEAKYLDAQAPFSLKFTLISPQGKEYIVPDQHWRASLDPKEFNNYASRIREDKINQKKLLAKLPNLIRNGGFEKGLKGLPVGWELQKWEERSASNTYVLSNEIKRSGKHSLKLEHNKLADSRWTQEVLVEPNTKYSLSGWVKTEGIDKQGRGAYLQIGQAGKKSELLTGTESWQKLEVKFETGPQQSEIAILCRLGDYGAPNTGTAYFDDVVLREVIPGKVF